MRQQSRLRGWSGEWHNAVPVINYDQGDFTANLRRRCGLRLGRRGYGHLGSHFGFHSEWRH